MRSLIKILAISAYVMVSALSLGACNTTEGFGKDVKETGKDIEQKAKDNK